PLLSATPPVHLQPTRIVGEPGRRLPFGPAGDSPRGRYTAPRLNGVNHPSFHGPPVSEGMDRSYRSILPGIASRVIAAARRSSRSMFRAVLQAQEDECRLD